MPSYKEDPRSLYIEFFLRGHAPAMCSGPQQHALTAVMIFFELGNLRRTPRDGLPSRVSVAALPHRLSTVPPAHAGALARS